MKLIAGRDVRLAVSGLLVGLVLVVAMAMPSGTNAAGASKGEELYKSKCANCHGPDAKGQTAMGKMLKLKDLGSAEVQKMSDAEIYAVIAKGKKPMKAYEGELKKADIDELVAYIRGLGKKEK